MHRLSQTLVRHLSSLRRSCCGIYFSFVFFASPFRHNQTSNDIFILPLKQCWKCCTKFFDFQSQMKTRHHNTSLVSMLMELDVKYCVRCIFYYSECYSHLKSFAKYFHEKQNSISWRKSCRPGIFELDVILCDPGIIISKLKLCGVSRRNLFLSIYEEMRQWGMFKETRNNYFKIYQMVQSYNSPKNYL